MGRVRVEEGMNGCGWRRRRSQEAELERNARDEKGLEEISYWRPSKTARKRYLGPVGGRVVQKWLLLANLFFLTKMRRQCFIPC